MSRKFVRGSLSVQSGISRGITPRNCRSDAVQFVCNSCLLFQEIIELLIAPGDGSRVVADFFVKAPLLRVQELLAISRWRLAHSASIAKPDAPLDSLAERIVAPVGTGQIFRSLTSSSL